MVSNGTLVETKENSDGTRTFHWKMDQPHSTYLITVAAADFVSFHDKVGNLPVDYYVTRNVDEATARRFMGKTPQMIRFFNEKTGQPYPYPKYAQVCLPEFGGGMENTSATSMTDSALLDEIEALEQDEDGLVAHELAHQWFGDLLTCKDWSHIWLNEGFASYFDPLFARARPGRGRVPAEDGWRAQQATWATTRMYRRPIVEDRYRSPMQMFDGMTYAKGGMRPAHAPRPAGRGGLVEGHPRYAAKNKFQVVETDDFRKAMEEASGKDLKWFFDQWLYKAGHPELKVRWHYEDADKTVRVKVEQTQKVDEQTPALPVAHHPGDHRGRGQEPRRPDRDRQAPARNSSFPPTVKPVMVRIDPDCWLIKELDFEKSVDGAALRARACLVRRLPPERRPFACSDNVKTIHEFRKRLATAWKHEKSVSARTEHGRADRRWRGLRPQTEGPCRARPGPSVSSPRRRPSARPWPRLRRTPRRRCASRPFAVWPGSSTTPQSEADPPRRLVQPQGGLRGAHTRRSVPWLDGRSRMPTSCSPWP